MSFRGLLVVYAFSTTLPCILAQKTCSKEKETDASCAGHTVKGSGGNSLLKVAAKLRQVGTEDVEDDPAGHVPAPQAAGWLGRGTWVAKGDYWHMKQHLSENLFTRSTPSSCYEEAPCQNTHNVWSHVFESVQSWSDYYSSSFSLGLSGSYAGFSGSVDASMGRTVSSSGDWSRILAYEGRDNTRKCYRMVKDSLCAYKTENLKPAFLDRVASLPTGAPYDAEKMEIWKDGFIQRFGTHVIMGSSHGALVQALASTEARSESASNCMKSQLCLKFGWGATVEASNKTGKVGLNMCSATDRCDNSSDMSLSDTAKCVALGGNPALQSQMCQKEVTQQTLEAWLEGGNLDDGGSAVRYSFMPLSDFLTNLDFAEYYSAARTLEKAVEYSNCRLNEDPPVEAWGPNGCQCVRQCANGGTLDAATCTCTCQGNAKHGFTGPNCEETYGKCQPGAGTGNPSSARACPVQNHCKSWYDSHVCQNTDVCCATNFGTKCCPYGSSCKCGVRSCECLSQ